MAWAFVAGAVVGAILAAVVAFAVIAARRPGRETATAPVASHEHLASKSLESLMVGVVVLDSTDQPVLANPAARALGLLRAGPHVGRPLPHPALRTLAGQVRHTGVRREVEMDLPRGRQASEDAVGVHLRAVWLGNGYVAVEAVDVTEAHRVAKVRRDFVANVSHELKTPIGALQLLAEALLDATAPADPPDGAPDIAAARRFADRIHCESARLGRLVSELIELSRLQGADPLPAPEPVSVDWLVAEVIDRNRTSAAAKGITVDSVGTRGLTVYGEGGQLATAVANLLENAITYSPDGSRVTINTSGDAESVRIAVIDEGMGIAPQDLGRVFERFYRTDQARSRDASGNGLGLAIVKHIATNHGGRVEVSSTLGAGSTFTLRLPARPPQAAQSLPASANMAEPVVEGKA